MKYGVIWHPETRNLGDDLQAYAASRLLPRVDLALDGETLDEEPACGGEPVTVLLGGAILRKPYHWPPHTLIRPVCLGVHVSPEDVWGCKPESLDGVGLRYLKEHAPIGCRDDATAALLTGMGIDNDVTCCLTLTLPTMTVTSDTRYVCCVDVPTRAVEALQRYEKAAHVQVKVMTHQLPPTACEESFETRMARAEETLKFYAGAELVVTRRLHCALACLALQVPVLMVFSSGYEDPRRFSPMDALFPVVSAEDFAASVERSGFPKLASNSAKYMAWRTALQERAKNGIARAEEGAAGAVITEAERTAWRMTALTRLAETSAKKISRLEQDRYDLIHDKFELLMTEDSVKNALADQLTQPGLEDEMRRYVTKRYIKSLPLFKRRAARKRIKKLRASDQPVPEIDDTDPLMLMTAQLTRLGWPAAPEKS